MECKGCYFSAAHYLAANGAANGEYEKAVFTYNQSQEYVAEVMKYATLFIQDGYKPIETVEPGKGGFARPVEGPVTSPFGPRVHPITGQVGKPHKGVAPREPLYRQSRQEKSLLPDGRMPVTQKKDMVSTFG